MQKKELCVYCISHVNKRKKKKEGRIVCPGIKCVHVKERLVLINVVRTILQYVVFCSAVLNVCTIIV